MSTRPVAVTVAGYDPTGGAGVQSDTRALEWVGVAAGSCVTALTVQTTHGVRSVHLTPADVLAEQLDSLMTDVRPVAVKCGMLGDAAQVLAVSRVLKAHRPRYIVLDPVLLSSNNVPLLTDAGRAVLVHELLPLCTLVTPNIDEWRLLGEPLLVPTLLKGGHLPGPPCDTLLLPSGETCSFPGERVETPHTHGTGCLLSALITGLLAHDYPLTHAIGTAKRILSDALHTPSVMGSGRGHPAFQTYGSHGERLEKVRGVYVVTADDTRPERGHLPLAQAALDGGATVIQLRSKGLATDELCSLAAEMVQVCHRFGAILVVNDRCDVALAADADGVHIGPGDVSPSAARRLIGYGRLLGISVGTPEEATAALPFASYLGIGAVFGTQTKRNAGAPIGVEGLTNVLAAAGDTPCVAIGGIDRARIESVAKTGVAACAVVSAVSQSAHMTEAVRELTRLFYAGKADKPRAERGDESDKSTT